jgi:hypothetical protein
VLEFDQAGNLVQSWGGPGQGYDWPDTEHGIFVDDKDNVWITGNGAKDTNLLKFTKAGKFLLQIGEHGKTDGSNDTKNVNQAAGIAVYAPTKEVVADGYGNRRVIVFDLRPAYCGIGRLRQQTGRQQLYGRKRSGTAAVQYRARHRRLE